ncbi:response regulator [Galbibacter sp. EGI 63066]|uniref:response regulator n=1 Tax=Galbibacter sp. EGI 63066 TaxID=2993559 RepID=UPI00224955A2|nr:response regulator [Galbibacter sp. EGI 63066]MCX2681767.1 response regulator [Galbibacter sp. EGI 63066]
MFKKVLVAEDIDSINEGLIAILKKTFNFDVHHAKYCDNAYLKIRKAQQDGRPYDLLITDLSFKQDHHTNTLNSGDELVAKLREQNIPMKVIIYSIEDRPEKIRTFFKRLNINSYICKGRNSTKEMVRAIKMLTETDQYVSAELQQTLRAAPVMEIEEYDILLINELANGNAQDEIAFLFKKQGIRPASKSSIEKRINRLKNYFKAKNTAHLVSIVKDMGLL